MTLTLASASLTLKQVLVAEKKTLQAESALVLLVEFEVHVWIFE